MPGRGDCVKFCWMTSSPVTEDGVVDVTLEITEDVITELREVDVSTTLLLLTWPKWLLNAEEVAVLKNKQVGSYQLSCQLSLSDPQRVGKFMRQHKQLPMKQTNGAILNWDLLFLSKSMILHLLEQGLFSWTTFGAEAHTLLRCFG